MPITGGCLCGAIRYACDAEPLGAYLCHCTDCQRSSAGPFSACIAMPADALRVTAGEPAIYERPGGSGRIVARRFCANCGTQLFSQSEQTPQMCVVRSGTLDDRTATAPGLHIWTQSALAWALPDDGARREPRGVPR
jgi:hypothetical protein